MWNGRILKISYPHLFSFAKDIKVIVRFALELEKVARFISVTTI
jgi:hypothetical protein